MSLRLLIDEDSQSKYLARLLKVEGHDIITINDLGMTGAPDDEVLAFARQTNRVVLTRNCDDFKALHEADSNHAGILLVRQDSNMSKDMKYISVSKAISNLETASIKLSGQCITLNHWKY